MSRRAIAPVFHGTWNAAKTGAIALRLSCARQPRLLNQQAVKTFGLHLEWLKVLSDHYAKRNSQFLRTAIQIAVAELDQVVICNGDQKQRISKQSFDDLSDQVNDSKPASISQA